MKKTLKNISIFMVGLFAVIAFPSVVNAQPSFVLNCGDKTSPSQVTASDPNFTCSLSVQGQDKITALKVKIIPDNQLEITNTTFNGTLWNKGTTDSSGFTTLTSMSDGESAGGIATIDAKLKPNAVHCGGLCVYITYTDAANQTLSASATGPFVTDSCSSSTPAPQKTPSSPSTGAFDDYAILIGGAAIGIAAVTVARRSTKFYRV